MRQVLSKRLLIRGFIPYDFAAQRPDFYRDMAQWIGVGQVKDREDFVGGLERAPEAFIGMLKGKNFGKLIVQVAD
jgi:NADPH-dependent curcumin reductase CurA